MSGNKVFDSAAASIFIASLLEIFVNDVPLVQVVFQGLLHNGAMQGFPLFGPFATVLCKECPMMLDQQVSQSRPFQNVKSVFTLRVNHDKDHDETLNRTSFGASDDLVS